MERLDSDLLFCWFVGLAIDDPVWDATVFSKNRDRLLDGAIAAKCLGQIDRLESNFVPDQVVGQALGVRLRREDAYGLHAVEGALRELDLFRTLR